MSWLRVAVIGVGDFGVRHLQAYREAGAELVAVADTDAGRVEQVCRDHQVPAGYTDLATLLHDTSPDAVSIVTPGPSHVPLALTALRAGCAVLLEKPVASNTAELAPLRSHAAADRVMPAHVLRFEPAFHRLRELYLGGSLGELIALAAQRERERGHRHRYPDADPVGLTAVHDLDLAGWITGWPAEQLQVTATALGSQPDLGGLVTARINTPSKPVWNVRASWLGVEGAPPYDCFTLYGTDGNASVTTAAGQLTLWHNDTVLLSYPSPAAPGLTGAIRHFCAALTHQTPFEVTLADADAGLRLISAIRASAATSISARFQTGSRAAIQPGVSYDGRQSPTTSR